MDTLIEYSNPRMRAEIENWPSGTKRVTAIFEIEKSPKGERATRKTTGTVKKLTYAGKARIVDGSDGRTYIAELSMIYGFISIMRGDMKFQHEIIHPDNERFARVKALFDKEEA